MGTLLWAIALALVLLLLGPGWLRLVAAAFVVALIARKTLQVLGKGQGLGVAVVYGLHTYFAKFPLAYGQLRFWCKRGAAK